MLIQDRNQFLSVVEKLAAAPSFSFDTEFIRERRYHPQLCLIQLAAPGIAVAVDPFVVGDLSPLVNLLVDPSVTKIVHAGQQDMEIFFAGSATVPRSVFDTQLAAALLGYGESVSYSRLVEDVLKLRVSKGEAFTDWARRPLAERQIEYALNDVRHLLPLHERMSRELDRLGRRAWLEEESLCYGDPSFYRARPELLYQRVRGAAKLTPRELSVLRELAAWREEEAQEMDRPRIRVLIDDFLLELARRAPETVEELATMRGIHPQLVKRSGHKIVRRVLAARSLPDTALPPPLERGARDSALTPVVDLLEIVLKARAHELCIGPGCIASRGTLHQLVLAHAADRSSAEHLELLRGWRWELVGKDLLDFLAGRTRLGLDAERARVVIVPA